MRAIRKKYKDKDFKLTPQRLAVLKCLDKNTSHPGAEDIYKAIKERCLTVSLSTVYNTIDILKKRGEIMEITIDPQKKHFDPNPEPHHHIICTKCRKIADIFEDYSALLTIPDTIKKEFTVTGLHVDFYGICKKCDTKKRGIL
ncbi:MAG: transcriptional repressor [Deltaproteobacteria bacterium]|nr:transcriptional repressor [Deltaproteobacteria bacterium]